MQSWALKNTDPILHKNNKEVQNSCQNFVNTRRRISSCKGRPYLWHASYAYKYYVFCTPVVNNNVDSIIRGRFRLRSNSTCSMP